MQRRSQGTGTGRGRRGTMLNRQQPIDEKSIRGMGLLGPLFSTSRQERLFELGGLSDELACPLSISTRGIGFAITRAVAKIRQQLPEQCDEIPDPAAMYRASLAQLQEKMDNARALPLSFPLQSDAPLYDVWPSSFAVNRPTWILESNNVNVSQIALIINSVGNFEYRSKQFGSVFAKEPSPLNLQITNLRDYCLEMANPETEAWKRWAGFELNSIPTAIWERKDPKDPQSVVLTNPDDVIPADYTHVALSRDVVKLHKWVNDVGKKIPELRGEIDYKRDGDPSLLVSTHLVPGQCLRLEKDILSGDESVFWARECIDHDAWCMGILSLTGEVLNPMDGGHRSDIDNHRMKRTRKTARGGTRQSQRTKQRMQEAETNPTLGKLLSLRLTLPIMDEACPLSVSTRGIGFMLSKVTTYLKECFPKLCTTIPIAAMYRASLAQLEAKIYFARSKQTRPFFFRSASERPLFEFQPTLSYSRARMIHDNRANISQIAFLINSIGHVEVNRMHYEPKFMFETSPINVRITNLREYCEEMADPRTEAAKRIVGYELNSIPNAVWARKHAGDPQSVVLTNPDEIIPPEYTNHMLMGDLMKTVSYVQRISSKRPDCRGLIDYERDGDPGLLVSANVISGQCLRLDDKNAVQAGDADRNFWSREPIDRYSWCAGVSTLAGEVFNSTIVPHRSKMLATRERFLSWNDVADALYSLEFKK